MKKTLLKILIPVGALFLTALILSIVLFSYACSFDLDIGGSQNLKILNELNADWQLDDEYTLQSIELGDLDLEWLYKENEPPTKAILQLHGGAYIRSLNYRENCQKLCLVLT